MAFDGTYQLMMSGEFQVYGFSFSAALDLKTTSAFPSYRTISVWSDLRYPSFFFSARLREKGIDGPEQSFLVPLGELIDRLKPSL